MPKITVEELSNRLARLHLEIVGFIVHDRETGVVGRIVTTDCPESVITQMDNVWGTGTEIDIPR